MSQPGYLARYLKAIAEFQETPGHELSQSEIILIRTAAEKFAISCGEVRLLAKFAKCFVSEEEVGLSLEALTTPYEIGINEAVADILRHGYLIQDEKGCFRLCAAAREAVLRDDPYINTWEDTDDEKLFSNLTKAVLKFLSEDEENVVGSGNLSFVVHASSSPPRSRFARRFKERFAALPREQQDVLLVLCSHFQRRGPVPWRMPKCLPDSLLKDRIQRTVDALLTAGIAVTTGDDLEPEARPDLAPVLLSIDAASFLFAGLDRFVNFGGCFSKVGSFVLTDHIQLKNLFYNQEGKAEVSRLERALSIQEFRNVTARLVAHGRRPALTCMLYGPPGTGKTELVYQLARAAGRNVIVADIAKLTGTYVGESERSYRQLFATYAYATHIMEVTPILLLNEADGFLVKRMETNRSSDKYENNLQTILLEEIEQFEGILFATSNKVTNMDTAYDRRFLLKIHIGTPDTNTRALIWRETFPGLSEADVAVLADGYRLTGAQIWDIGAKVDILEVLDGNKVSFESIADLCRSAEQGVIGTT